MARRFFNHYFIDLGDGQQWKVSADEWRQAVAGRWIAPSEPTSRIARLCAGVVARVKGGVLWLRDRFREVFIRTSWGAIDDWAPVRGEHWQRDIEDEYGPYRFERWGEIRRQVIGWNGVKPHEVAG